MFWYSHVEWPLPAHLDLYQIVRQSSRRRKCRCFFHDLDLTFLRVDPAIITLTCGSSWMPAQSHVKSQRSPSCHTSDTAPSELAGFQMILYYWYIRIYRAQIFYPQSEWITCTHVSLQDPLLFLNHASGNVLLKRSRCQRLLQMLSPVSKPNTFCKSSMFIQQMLKLPK